MKCERCGSTNLETSDTSIGDDEVTVEGYCMDCKKGGWYYTATYKLSGVDSWSEEYDDE